MADRDYQEFRSRLGTIAVTDSHIERDRNNSGDWKALENIPDEKMINEIHFSDVKQLNYQEGSTYPYIQFQTERGHKKMFFSIGDPVQDIFTTLKEKIAPYSQAYQ